MFIDYFVVMGLGLGIEFVPPEETGPEEGWLVFVDILCFRIIIGF